MTLNGAIKQLQELRSAEDMPIYYKPVIAEVINVLLMDTQEVRHGHLIVMPLREDKTADVTAYYEPIVCSVCGSQNNCESAYCSYCGAKMDEEEE